MCYVSPISAAEAAHGFGGWRGAALQYLGYFASTRHKLPSQTDREVSCLWAVITIQSGLGRIPPGQIMTYLGITCLMRSTMSHTHKRDYLQMSLALWKAHRHLTTQPHNSPTQTLPSSHQRSRAPTLVQFRCLNKSLDATFYSLLSALLQTKPNTCDIPTFHLSDRA